MKKKMTLASTKSKHTSKPVTGHSSYWLGDNYEHENNGRTDILELVKYRNAISNFVTIAAGQGIPVNFHANDSFTDGKTVTISSKLDHNGFDTTVGLALHEGSHILLTDFKIITKLADYINTLYSAEPVHVRDHILKVFEVDSINSFRYMHYVKDLLNIVEDRRIDNYIFTTSPGYRGYYIALYDKYFNNKLIDNGLKSNVYRDETLESYFFRICNITNPNTDLDALKGLRSIYDIFDLSNISRLKTTHDALIVAWEIFKTIIANIPAPELNDANRDMPSKQDDNESGGQDDSESGSQDDSESGSQDDSESGSQDDNESSSQDDSESGSQDTLTLNDSAQYPHLYKLQKAINNQRNFINGNVKKHSINKKDQKSLQSVIEANAKLHDIYVPNSSIQSRVIILPKLTTQMITQNPLGMSCIRRCTEYDRYIINGIHDGVKLAKKIQRRNEDYSIKFNRLRTGMLDRRRIADIGIGVDDIFSRTITTTYNRSIIYLNIDLSGSMDGRKWQRTVQLASAIGKVAAIVEGIDAVISVRNTDVIAGSTSPVVLTIFDSRVDSIFQLTNALMNIRPTGGTPEGLCFEAMLPIITKTHAGSDVYFINISDGEPSHGSYYGSVAYAHTNKQIQAMIKSGVRVLSYFISDDIINTRNQEAFRLMYGKDAEFVDTSNINIIATTINDKLMMPAAE
jgi:hypothetical protein